METEVSNNVENVENDGCLGNAGGCLIKVLGFFLMIIFFSFVKTCSESMTRNSLRYSAQTEYVDYDKSDVDDQLNRVMDQIRADLPKRIDEVTIQKDATCTIENTLIKQPSQSLMTYFESNF